MAETWVINESPVIPSGKLFDSISFTSNNAEYTEITIWSRLGGIEYDFDNVFNNTTNSWADQAYRTVTFETAPTGDLLTWLQANAEKQQPTSITLDLSTIGLAIGTHSIQMTLSDNEVTKRDSELSNAVTYNEYDYEVDGNTLILNTAPYAQNNNEVVID